MSFFVACMMQHPNVQERAQEEIDRVVGREKLPGLEDRDALPFIGCVVQETMRYVPFAA